MLLTQDEFLKLVLLSRLIFVNPLLQIEAIKLAITLVVL
jgi:hypothetical protein